MKQLVLASLIPEWIHHELLNWSRWCWSGSYPHPLPSSRCASLEGQFVSAPEWGGAEDDDSRAPIHVDSALRVQAIYEALPRVERLVIRAEYPARHSYAGSRAAASAIGVSVSHYQDSFVNGSMKIGAALR